MPKGTGQICRTRTLCELEVFVVQWQTMQRRKSWVPGTIHDRVVFRFLDANERKRSETMSLTVVFDDCCWRAGCRGDRYGYVEIAWSKFELQPTSALAFGIVLILVVFVVVAFGSWGCRHRRSRRRLGCVLRLCQTSKTRSFHLWVSSCCSRSSSSSPHLFYISDPSLPVLITLISSPRKWYNREIWLQKSDAHAGRMLIGIKSRLQFSFGTLYGGAGHGFWSYLYCKASLSHYGHLCFLSWIFAGWQTFTDIKCPYYRHSRL